MAEKYDADPLVHGTGTLLGIYTMITRGESLLHSPPAIPSALLVQHGTDDKVTSVEATKTMYANLPSGNPDRELRIWDGYFHELHNEPEDERNEAIKYIAEWILARCGDMSVPKARL
jgi:acylglycerol lipase